MREVMVVSFVLSWFVCILTGVKCERAYLGAHIEGQRKTLRWTKLTWHTRLCSLS